jgi:hypothetical protein
MRTIYLRIPTPAFEELRRLAQLELRGPKEQALLLILEGLERRGDFLHRARGVAGDDGV